MVESHNFISSAHSEDIIDSDGFTRKKRVVRTECEEILRRRVTSFPSEESNIRSPPVFQHSQQSYLNALSSSSFGCQPTSSSSRQYYSRQPTRIQYPNATGSVDSYRLRTYPTPTSPRFYDDYHLKYSYNCDSAKNGPLLYGGTKLYNERSQSRSYNYYSNRNTNYNCNSSNNRYRYSTGQTDYYNYLSNPYAKYIGGGNYSDPPAPQFETNHNSQQHNCTDDSTSQTNGNNGSGRNQSPDNGAPNKSKNENSNQIIPNKNAVSGAPPEDGPSKNPVKEGSEKLTPTDEQAVTKSGLHNIPVGNTPKPENITNNAPSSVSGNPDRKNGSHTPKLTIKNAISGVDIEDSHKDHANAGDHNTDHNTSQTNQPPDNGAPNKSNNGAPNKSNNDESSTPIIPIKNTVSGAPTEDGHKNPVKEGIEKLTPTDEKAVPKSGLQIPVGNAPKPENIPNNTPSSESGTPDRKIGSDTPKLIVKNAISGEDMEDASEDHTNAGDHNTDNSTSQTNQQPDNGAPNKSISDENSTPIIPNKSAVSGAPENGPKNPVKEGSEKISPTNEQAVPKSGLHIPVGNAPKPGNISNNTPSSVSGNPDRKIDNDIPKLNVKNTISGVGIEKEPKDHANAADHNTDNSKTNQPPDNGAPNKSSSANSTPIIPNKNAVSGAPPEHESTNPIKEGSEKLTPTNEQAVLKSGLQIPVGNAEKPEKISNNTPSSESGTPDRKIVSDTLKLTAKNAISGVDIEDAPKDHANAGDHYSDNSISQPNQQPDNGAPNRSSSDENSSPIIPNKNEVSGAPPENGPKNPVKEGIEKLTPTDEKAVPKSGLQIPVGNAKKPENISNNTRSSESGTPDSKIASDTPKLTIKNAISGVDIEDAPKDDANSGDHYSDNSTSQPNQPPDNGAPNRSSSDENSSPIIPNKNEVSGSPPEDGPSKNSVREGIGKPIPTYEQAVPKSGLQIPVGNAEKPENISNNTPSSVTGTPDQKIGSHTPTPKLTIKNTFSGVDIEDSTNDHANAADHNNDNSTSQPKGNNGSGRNQPPYNGAPNKSSNENSNQIIPNKNTVSGAPPEDGPSKNPVKEGSEKLTPTDEQAVPKSGLQIPVGNAPNPENISNNTPRSESATPDRKIGSDTPKLAIKNTFAGVDIEDAPKDHANAGDHNTDNKNAVSGAPPENGPKNPVKEGSEKLTPTNEQPVLKSGLHIPVGNAPKQEKISNNSTPSSVSGTPDRKIGTHTPRLTVNTFSGVDIEDAPNDHANAGDHKHLKTPTMPPYHPPVVSDKPLVKYNLTTGETIKVDKKHIKPVTIDTGNQHSISPTNNTHTQPTRIPKPEIKKDTSPPHAPAAIQKGNAKPTTNSTINGNAKTPPSNKSVPEKVKTSTPAAEKPNRITKTVEKLALTRINHDKKKSDSTTPGKSHGLPSPTQKRVSSFFPPALMHKIYGTPDSTAKTANKHTNPRTFRSYEPPPKPDKRRASSPPQVLPQGHKPYYAPGFSNLKAEPVKEERENSIPDASDRPPIPERKRASSPVGIGNWPPYAPPPTNHSTGDPTKADNKEHFPTFLSPNSQENRKVPYHDLEGGVEYTPILHRPKPYVHDHHKKGHPNQNIEFKPYNPKNPLEGAVLEGALEIAFQDVDEGITEWESYSIVTAEEPGPSPDAALEKSKPLKKISPRLKVPSHIVPHSKEPHTNEIKIPDLNNLLLPDVSISRFKTEFDEYLEQYEHSIVAARAIALTTLQPHHHNVMRHGHDNSAGSATVNLNQCNAPTNIHLAGQPGCFSESDISSLRSDVCSIPSSTNFVSDLPTIKEDSCNFDVYSIRSDANYFAFEAAVNSVESMKEMDMKHGNSQSSLISQDNSNVEDSKSSIIEISPNSNLENNSKILNCSKSVPDHILKSLMDEQKDIDRYIDEVLHRSMNYEDSIGDGDESSISMNSSLAGRTSDFTMEVSDTECEVLLSTDILSEYEFSEEETEMSEIISEYENILYTLSCSPSQLVDSNLNGNEEIIHKQCSETCLSTMVETLETDTQSNIEEVSNCYSGIERSGNSTENVSCNSTVNVFCNSTEVSCNAAEKDSCGSTVDISLNSVEALKASEIDNIQSQKETVDKNYSFTETAYRFLAGVTSEYLLPITSHFFNLDGNKDKAISRQTEASEIDNNNTNCGIVPETVFKTEKYNITSDETRSSVSKVDFNQNEESYNYGGIITVDIDASKVTQQSQKQLISVLKKSSAYIAESIPKPSHGKNVHFGFPITTTKIINDDIKDEQNSDSEASEEDLDLEMSPATVFFQRTNEYYNLTTPSVTELSIQDTGE